MIERPLEGKRVLVTRPVAQAESLAARIREAGAKPVLFPTVAIEATPANSRLRADFNRLGDFALVIFVSVNAVRYGLARARDSGGIPDGCSLVAVGRATAAELEKVSEGSALVPESGFDSEALLALPELQSLQGREVLIVRGVGGRALLGEVLGERGAQVRYAEVYRRALPTPRSLPRVNWKEIDAVTITSIEILDNLLMLAGPEGARRIKEFPCVVISERIAAHAREVGFSVVRVSPSPGEDAIVGALSRYFE